MSDYLWDKTGEADEEARRLEELLGGLKFRPRPLELPALPARLKPSATPARNPGAARTTRTPLPWPRLALAASLAAALLLGAWLMIAGRRTTDDAPQLAGQKDQPGANGEVKELPTVASAGGGEDETKNPDELASPGPREASPREVGLRKVGPREAGPREAGPREAAGARRQLPLRQIIAGGRERTRTPRANRIEAAGLGMTRVNREPRVEVAQFTAEEIAAAEKVMFALRLTSEKLAYARQQVQDAGRREPDR